MDTLVTVCAIIGAIAIKVLFFFLYARLAGDKAPKKSEPYEVIQKGAEPSGKEVKRVLVTGGCGYLGSSIVRQLCERFAGRVAVVVLDSAVHTKFGPLAPAATYVRGDICTYTHLRIASHGAACVVHTAGVVGDCVTRDALYARVNEQGTRNVVEACLEKDVGALVYTSSASVVFRNSAAPPNGGGGVLEPILETTAALPAAELNGPYARSKAAAERLVLAASSHVLHAVALRPGGVYGLRDAGIASSALEGKPFIAPGNVRVPFVWVEDAARAHVDAVELLLFPKPDAPRIHGRAYHLCHDPVRDPFLYREFGGAPLLQASLDAKHEAVRAAEAEAGVGAQPPPQVNAYSMKVNGGISYGIIRRLALVNYWLGQKLGCTLIDATLTPVALRYAANHWPCDVADARRLLGWEATPWRVVAARLGEEALDSMPSARKRYVAWTAGSGGAGGAGGKAKVA